MSVRVIQGDALETLRTLPEESVHCCVTSPPYFALRDYGVAGQMGLEPTPEAYAAAMVGVFREVRRVLRDDGTLWLNIGDSYATGAGGVGDCPGGGKQGENWKLRGAMTPPNRMPLPGLKPKDLIGIPWALATALRAPYYTGRIGSERDRVWLAAIVDGEGCISGYEHTRRDDGKERTGLNICVTNTNVALLAECSRVWPASTHNHVPAGAGHLGSRRVDRWIPQGAAEKAQLLTELYPYLIAKRAQAIVGWNLAQAIMRGKSDGHLPGAADARARRVVLVSLLRALNAGSAVDLPSWLDEPPSPYEPGWYLRQEIIWAKKNCMPESVRDRCTKSHEQLFLLSKSRRYYFDADAIAEDSITLDPRKPYCPGQVDVRGNGHDRNGGAVRTTEDAGTSRNKRSVWTVATQPFSEAHFATFPPALVEPCILAGCPIGGTVLDPFGGAGTTGLVADRLQRSAILIELNPAYAEMARRRIRSDATLFADVA